MSDTWSWATNPLSSFFFAGKDDKNVPQALRQKIALAMLMQKRAAPKTFGEGLSAIGDALGDRAVMRQIEGDAAGAEGTAAAARSEILGAPAPAPAPARAPYAPPDSTPPAVSAINRAVAPSPRPVPGAPGGGAAPVAAGPDGMTVAPGDYNEIDAADPRNRYKPPPAYLAPALERNIADPERRAYLGQLAGKEAQSATEVSPTGAAGPFQFTRGTGAQYGIPGNARLDPDASTIAANRLTDDNAKALTARLGRDPTAGELALAHQQGAGTAANMLTGSGNAPPRNLAVNNVDPGTPPQAAAQKVMSYYNMPGATGVASSPRDNVALALAAQGNDAAPPEPGRPTVADYGQKLVLAPTPDQGIRPAPSAAPIQKIPPPPVAQADYVLDLPPEPKPPPTMTPTMQRIQQKVQDTSPSQRDTVRDALKPLYEQEEAKLAQANAAYKDALTQHRALQLKQEEQRATAAQRGATYSTTLQEQEKRKLEIDDAREKSLLQARLGGRAPEQVFTEFDKDKASAEKTVNALNQYAVVRDMISKGVITGTGQGWKVNAAKVASVFGISSAAEAVSRTEQMQAALKSTLGIAIDTIQGSGQKVSDADMAMASGTIGADPALQLQTIKSLTERAEKISRSKINEYEDQRDYYFGGTRAERRYQVPTPSTAPEPHVRTLLEHKNSDEVKKEFDARFGPGAAELEIARAKRRERRGG